MNRILLVSSFCDVCSAVSGSISWARWLPVVTAESGLPLMKNWHISSHLSLQLRLSLRKLREWNFLRVVDERTNVANSCENQLVCSVR